MVLFITRVSWWVLCCWPRPAWHCTFGCLKGHDFAQSTLSSWEKDQVGSDHLSFWDYQDKDHPSSNQSAATSQHLSLGVTRKKEPARIHPVCVTGRQHLSANLSLAFPLLRNDFKVQGSLKSPKTKQALNVCHWSTKKHEPPLRAVMLCNPSAFGYSWLPACWHNKQRAISL